MTQDNKRSPFEGHTQGPMTFKGVPFTSGTWWYAQENPDDPQYSFVVGSGDCVIAAIRGIPPLACAISNFEACHATGNAALIAAAPDLLRERDEARALVAELAQALSDLLDEADLGEVDEETAPIVDAARAVLAKVQP